LQFNAAEPSGVNHCQLAALCEVHDEPDVLSVDLWSCIQQPFNRGFPVNDEATRHTESQTKGTVAYVEYEQLPFTSYLVQILVVGR
jgi:hypothetical protein